jgi:hypothetical protein
MFHPGLRDQLRRSNVHRPQHAQEVHEFMLLIMALGGKFNCGSETG